MSGSDSQIAMQGRPIDIAGEQLKWMKPQTEFLNQGLIGAQTGEAQARIPFIGAQTQVELARANQLIPAQAYEATGAGQYSRAHALIQPQIGYKAEQEGLEAGARTTQLIPAQTAAERALVPLRGAQTTQHNVEAENGVVNLYKNYIDRTLDRGALNQASESMGQGTLPPVPQPSYLGAPTKPAPVSQVIPPALTQPMPTRIGFRADDPANQSALAMIPDPALRSIMYNAARAADVPVSLLVAQKLQESGTSSSAARGTSGEYGVMQVMPATGASLGFSEQQLQNTQLNVLAGAKYQRQLLDQHNNMLVAGAAYNTGRTGTAVPNYMLGTPNGSPGLVGYLSRIHNAAPAAGGAAPGQALPAVAGGLPVAGGTTVGAMPTALPPGIGQPLIGGTPAAQAAPAAVPAAPVVAPSPVPTPTPAAPPPTPANLIPRNSPFAPGNPGVVPTRGDAGPDTISENAAYIPGLTPFPIPKSYLPQLVKDRSTEGMARLEAERKKDLVTTFDAQAGVDATPPMDRYNAGVNAIFGKGIIWGSQAAQLLNHPEMAEEIRQGQLPVAERAGTKALAAAVTGNITQINKFIEDDSKKNSENVDAHLIAAKNGLQMREFRDTVKGAPTGAGADWRLPLQQMATQFTGPWTQKLSSYITGIKGEPTVVQMETANKMALNGVVGQEAAIPGVRPGAMLTTYLAKANPNTNMRNISIENMLNLGLVAQQMTTDFGIGSNQYFKNAFDNHQAELKAGHLTYDRLQNFEASWNSPGSDHAPAVYAASAALLNGVDPTPKGAFNGLTDSQKAEAVRIAWRADPAAIIAGHRLGQ